MSQDNIKSPTSSFRRAVAGISVGAAIAANVVLWPGPLAVQIFSAGLLAHDVTTAIEESDGTVSDIWNNMQPSEEGYQQILDHLYM